MRKLTLLAFAFVFCAALAAAQPATQGANPYQDWLTYYYMEKDASKVPGFLRWLEASKTLDRHPAALPPIEEFLTVLFEQNRDKVPAWSEAASFTGNTAQAMHYALQPPEQPQDIEIKAPADIDRMWGAFSASGDDVYLKKVVDALEPKKSWFGKAKPNDALQKAAAWSLGSNMTQHEAVDRFLVSESEQHTGKLGDALKTIIASVRAQRDKQALPNRNGEFSAMLFVTDPAVAGKELARASGDIVHFSEMRDARRGDKRTAVIVFAGMQLTPDYQANVTYDVQQIDPSGKVYSDIKDLEGIKEKVPTRFRIFNNKQAIFIAFDKKDKPGLYQLHILLKDNVSGKTIPMAAQIMLQK